MAGTVLSLNIGSSEPNPAKDVKVTGINKRPVLWAELRAPGPKRGGLGSGVKGDFIGDRASHGGDRQAVYAFAREELDWWEERLGRSLASGSFGENLTTEGLAVDDSLVGDRWTVGDEVALEVTGPRIPCATFRHTMGEQGWLRRFTEVGRSGAYLAVITGGVVRPGDPIKVVGRADHGITVLLAFRAFTGDLDAAERVVAAHCLAPADEEWLRQRVARRTS